MTFWCYLRWVIGNEGGFIHKSFVGRFVGGVAKRGLQFAAASGIPVVSQVARGVSSFTAGGSRNRAFISARSSQLTRGRTTTRLLPAGLTPKGPGGILGAIPGVPGGVTGFQVDAMPMTGGECPKGFHLNKAEYFLKSEGMVVPTRSRCVKNRHRNPDNGRASMRAASRLLARKRHSDKIDDALSSLVKRRSPRKKSASRPVGPLIVQN